MKFKYLSLIMLIGASVAQGSDSKGVEDGYNAELSELAATVKVIEAVEDSFARSASAVEPRRSPVASPVERSASAPARIESHNKTIKRLKEEERRAYQDEPLVKRRTTRRTTNKKGSPLRHTVATKQTHPAAARLLGERYSGADIKTPSQVEFKKQPRSSSPVSRPVVDRTDDIIAMEDLGTVLQNLSKRKTQMPAGFYVETPAGPVFVEDVD